VNPAAKNFFTRAASITRTVTLKLYDSQAHVGWQRVVDTLPFMKEY
jgi:hypothetical protein